MVIICNHYLNCPKYIKQEVEIFYQNCGKELLGTPENCFGCGDKPSTGNSFCHACGAATETIAEVYMKCGAQMVKSVSPARIGLMPTAAGILSIVAGAIVFFKPSPGMM